MRQDGYGYDCADYGGNLESQSYRDAVQETVDRKTAYSKDAFLAMAALIGMRMQCDDPVNKEIRDKAKGYGACNCRHAPTTSGKFDRLWKQAKKSDAYYGPSAEPKYHMQFVTELEREQSPKKSCDKSRKCDDGQHERTISDMSDRKKLRH